MRPILIASSVPSGDAWKEVFVTVIICGLMYLIGYGMVGIFHRYGNIPLSSSAEFVSWLFAGSAACVFWFRGFPLQAVICLAAGAALQIRAEYGVDAGMIIPELIIGYLLFLRGYSFGPARGA